MEAEVDLCADGELFVHAIGVDGEFPDADSPEEGEDKGAEFRLDVVEFTVRERRVNFFLSLLFVVSSSMAIVEQDNRKVKKVVPRMGSGM